MSKYSYEFIQDFKYFQITEIRKLVLNYNDCQLNIAIKKFRCINRIRKKNILDDIISFEKYITQEFFKIILGISN